MSSQIDRIYKKAFRKHFSNHECNFPLSRNLKLGDYGVIRNGYYENVGNISSFGVEIEVRKDDHPSHEVFKSTSGVSLNFATKGEVSNSGVAVVKPSVTIGFDSEEGVFFSSANVLYDQIINNQHVADSILKLYEAGKWQKEWYVVTKVINGDNAIIIIGGKTQSSCKIEAGADIETLDLANAELDLSFSSINATSYEVIAKRATLGIGLSRVYNPWFNEPTFKVMASTASTSAKLDYENSGNEVFGDVSPSFYDHGAVMS